MGATELNMKNAEKMPSQGVSIDSIDKNNRKICQALAVLGLLEDTLLNAVSDAFGMSPQETQRAAEAVWAIKDLIAEAEV